MAQAKGKMVSINAVEALRDVLIYQGKLQDEKVRGIDLLEDFERSSPQEMAKIQDGAFPWTSNFGKNASKNYYYQNEPTEAQLAHVARHFPIGYRLTYGRAKDGWQNNFILNFPANSFNPNQLNEINAKITKHFTKIKLYSQGRRATALDYIQGESLLMKFREGDGVSLHEQIMGQNLTHFQTPEDPNKKILYVEAIDKVDYTFEGDVKNGTFMYRINFYDKNSTQTGFLVHPSRVIRWRSEQWDYETYNGYSKLLPHFGQLLILQQICFSMGNAIERYGHGFPLILVKNAQKKEQLQRIAQLIGDPTSRSWLMLPKELVDSFEFKGVNGSAMNFEEVVTTMIDQIASGSQIPVNIMMGREGYISKSGEVFDRDYFGTLDKDHNEINPFLEELISQDPEIQDIFDEYGIPQYFINWGLKQVMTESEKADLQMKIYTNINSSLSFKFFIECRAEANLPSFEEKFAAIPNGTKICKDLYGLTPVEMDYLIPNLGTFRQQLVTEQTDPKQEETLRNEQMLAENNNPTNKARHEGTAIPTNAGSGANKQAEAKRREAKAERGNADELEDARKEIALLKASMTAKDDMFNEMLDSLKNLRNLKDQQDRKLSMQELAEEVDIPRSTLYNLLNKIEHIKKK